MKTRTLEIYEFSELPEEAKQKAIKKLSEDYDLLAMNIDMEFEQINYELSDAKACLIDSNLDQYLQELLKLDAISGMKLTEYDLCRNTSKVAFNYDGTKLIDYLLTQYKATDRQRIKRLFDADILRFYGNCIYCARCINCKKLSNLLNKLISEFESLLEDIQEDLSIFCLEFLKTSEEYYTSEEYFRGYLTESEIEFNFNGTIIK